MGKIQILHLTEFNEEGEMTAGQLFAALLNNVGAIRDKTEHIEDFLPFFITEGLGRLRVQPYLQSRCHSWRTHPQCW